jgi:phosphatidate cytidylyltransferase
LLSAALLVPIALACVWIGGAPFALLTGAAVLGLLTEWAALWRRKPGALGLPPAAALAAGIAYILAGAIGFAWLRTDPAVGRSSVLFLLAAVWVSDSAAYAGGRAIRGPRLAPRISPGKTWAGAICGLLATGLAGCLLDWILARAAAPGRAALSAAGISLVAQAGDLLESWVKRRVGAKDSGVLIPGHGGLIDRLDALLAASLLAALLALAAGRGVAFWE